MPSASSPEGAGTVIGPYKLLEQIGEGGVGTVWMAQQTERFAHPTPALSYQRWR